MNDMASVLNRNNTIGVYLGAALGNDPAYKNAVIEFGKGIVELGYTLVYGGASIGLMGLLADVVKKSGGKVIAVITKHLEEKEILFEEADEKFVVNTMYERKKLIHDLSSRFVIFPGGLGTFDELFETWCNIKIGVFEKKIDFININGFFDQMFNFVDFCCQQGFLSESQIRIPSIYRTANDYLNNLVRSVEYA